MVKGKDNREDGHKWPVSKLEPEGLDGLLFSKMDTVRGRRRRTRGVKKQVAGEVATDLTRDSAVQGSGLGYGAEQPKPPGTPSTGVSTGVSRSKREKVDREVERCCQCTRHSTCRRT